MWSDRFSVKEKKVLLTGAAGSIGMALLEGFLEAGANVMAVTKRSETDWNGLDVKFSTLLHTVTFDLTDADQVKMLAFVAENELAGVDVLINCASLCPHATHNFYSIELLQATMKVTLEAAYILCGILAPSMAKRGQGSIINITTMNAEKAWPGNPAYITAKSGLRMLTKAVARDFGEKGVRANCLCPGYVHSKLTDSSFLDAEMHEVRRSHTMLGRWGTPDDMVGPCIFLASDASKYITGADLHVEGGWLSKGM